MPSLWICSWSNFLIFNFFTLLIFFFFLIFVPEYLYLVLTIFVSTFITKFKISGCRCEILVQLIPYKQFWSILSCSSCWIHIRASAYWLAPSRCWYSFADLGRMESWKGHTNVQISAEPEIERGTLWLEIRILSTAPTAPPVDNVWW